MKTRKNNKNWNFPKILFRIFLVFILILFIQMVYLSMSPNIYGINIDKFAANRNTTKQKLIAARGTIYDIEGNILSHNITSYTVIAYLSEKRTGSGKTPMHVVDKDGTAEKLAPILNMSTENILKLLSKNSYQVELGPGGRGITELTKKSIEELGLPGIAFIESHKRYYPNGDFASYTVGYAKDKEVENPDKTKTKVTVGELGIEKEYDKLLKGTDGYLEFQKDRFGYKIPDTKEIRVDAIDGKDVYLTLDSNIQRFVETAVRDASNASKPEWMVLSVMDAKTGKILATSSTPTFDPNKKNITNYQNPLVSFTYEPGSTMKTFSYMCAIEKGTYVGNATFDSTKIDFTDDTIRDWNRVGFGNISYDKGFEYSSNVGASNIMQRFLTRENLKKCYSDYGFGNITDLELPNENAGKINFKYPVETASASFGQGITTTVVQQLRALTIISNNGKMLTPHIVEKIVDPKTGKVVYQSKKEETKALVSLNTANKMKDLMYNVVHGTDPFTTGRAYQIEGYDVIGKTGTAQYVNPNTGKYVDGSYIYSFSGMYPKDDPEIIIYAALAKPQDKSNVTMQKAVKEVMLNIATYKNLFNKTTEITKGKATTIKSFTNKNLVSVKNDLESKGLKVIVIGNGSKIVDQYPKKNTKVNSDETVILKTSGNEMRMPNMTGWSRMIAKEYFDLVGCTYTMDGYGFVETQNVAENLIITKESEIVLTLKQKYNLE
jgi:Cell division protein FtsI/penicillin-binding protein 2